MNDRSLLEQQTARPDVKLLCSFVKQAMFKPTKVYFEPTSTDHDPKMLQSI